MVDREIGGTPPADVVASPRNEVHRGGLGNVRARVSLSAATLCPFCACCRERDSAYTVTGTLALYLSALHNENAQCPYSFDCSIAHCNKLVGRPLDDTVLQFLFAPPRPRCWTNRPPPPPRLHRAAHSSEETRDDTAQIMWRLVILLASYPGFSWLECGSGVSSCQCPLIRKRRLHGVTCNGETDD